MGPFYDAVEDEEEFSDDNDDSVFFMGAAFSSPVVHEEKAGGDEAIPLPNEAIAAPPEALPKAVAPPTTKEALMLMTNNLLKGLLAISKHLLTGCLPT